jgi:hypothetical protein
MKMRRHKWRAQNESRRVLGGITLSGRGRLPRSVAAGFSAFGSSLPSASPLAAGFRLAFVCLTLCSCGFGRGHDPDQAPGQQPQPAPKPAAGAPDSPRAQESKQRAQIDPNKFAIIISGVGGEEIYSKKFASQAAKLYAAITDRLGFAAKNVILLTETAAGSAEDGIIESEKGAPAATARSTAEEVRKAFARVKGEAKPDSQVLVVMIGHGSFDNQQPKFNLVGPDLAARDYAALLDSLPTRRVVFVNCSSASGEFIKPLSGSGRIVITATRSGNEQNVTVFADYFIAALTDDAADADKNGRVSVLEAFNYATKLTADWYKQQGRLATEHALIDDNGDGVGHEDATGGDGLLAKTTYLDSKQIEEAKGDAALTELLAKKQRIEESVEKLKARKDQMKSEEYEAELERLLVELANVNQEIKARKK